MKFIPTAIPDVIVVDPEVFGDARGFFMETWHARKFVDAGIEADFVQDNHSKSVKGTLRGLHYQIKQPQGKLVRVSAGEIYDVAVDLRESSTSFGRWVGQRLSAENKKMIWVPIGFAHGFYVTSACAEVIYKCTDFYAPEHERSLRWDDPDVAIDWPLLVDAAPKLSAKDAAAPSFRDAEYFA
jgi:dTDP-4-dehydrorhamnose 3,5-epimerase